MNEKDGREVRDQKAVPLSFFRDQLADAIRRVKPAQEKRQKTVERLGLFAIAVEQTPLPQLAGVAEAMNYVRPGLVELSSKSAWFLARLALLDRPLTDSELLTELREREWETRREQAAAEPEP